MVCVEVALLLLGIVLLVVGYRRNHRKLLLAGTIALFLSGAGPQLVTGFGGGIHDGIISWARR